MEKIRVIPILICLMVALIFVGCASTRSSTSKVISSETIMAGTIEQGNEGNFPKGEDSSERAESRTTKTEKKTETTEERTKGGAGGILGTTIHFIGHVIAFPFKILAGVISLYFNFY